VRRPHTIATLFCVSAIALLAGKANAQAACSLTCPANITAATAPGANNVVINFATPTPTGACMGTTPVQTAGLPIGSAFPVGTTINAWSLGFNPSEATCQFSVTITATPAVVGPSAPVPSVSATMLGLLGMLLGVAGFAVLRRRT
jgi:hypothetical protein